MERKERCEAGRGQVSVVARLPDRMGKACRVSEQKAYRLVQTSGVTRQVRGPIGVKRALAKYG